MLKRVFDPNQRPVANATQAPEPAPGVAGIDLLKYLGLARRRGPLVAAFGLIAGLLGSIYAMQLVPVYQATATLLIDPSQSNALSPAGGGYNTYVDDGRIESELAIISSSSVARRVVEKLRLDEEPAPEMAEPSATAQIIAQMKSVIFAVPEKSEPSIDLTSDPKDILARQVQYGVGVKRVGFSYLIDVSYTSENSAKAAAIANAFVDEYLVDQLESRYDATRRANDWLNVRLGDLRNKVRDSERAVEVFKTQNNIVDTQGGTLSDQQIGKLNEQLILARAETAQALASYEQIQAVVKRGGDASSFADAAQAAAIGELRAKASDIRREMAELSAKYGARHPTVVSLRAQLGDISGQIRKEAGRTVAAVENQYRVAKSREASIEASLNEMKGDATLTSQAEITLRELERDATANRALYESFLSKFKETSQQETLKASTARIIERAAVPTAPSGPNKKRIALVWLVAGLLGGAALAFVLEKLDSGFRSVADAERVLGVPVLASVPQADHEVSGGLLSGLLARLDFVTPFLRVLGLSRSHASARSRKLRVAMSHLVVDKPLSAFTEAMRALRMGVRFAGVDTPRKVILFTSALPGEGKSTIASNFAQQAAAAGERVVLIDMDLRHPAVSEVYAPAIKVGLVDVIMGSAELKDVIVAEKITEMSFIPAPRGRKYSHTAELLGSKPVKDILDKLSENFDLIVIDSAPLLPVTDSRVLIDVVDAMVLVIRWETTKRDAVTAALGGCFGLGEKFIGTVLSQVVPSRARYDGYYKSGYYMKKYPEYYGGKG